MRSVSIWIFASSIGVCPLAGCDTFPGAFLGAGSQVGVSKTVGSIVFHTYTAPLPVVSSAALDALGNMQVDVSSIHNGGSSEEILAKTRNRDIDIQLEEISPNVTRMSVTAKSGIFPYDSATGDEILRQTGCAMTHTECNSRLIDP